MRYCLLLFVCWVAPLSAQTLDSVRSYQAMRVDSTSRWYTKTVVRVDTLRQPLPSKALSIPIGFYHADLKLIGTSLTGTLKYGDPVNWKAQLDSVRGKGSIFFALTSERAKFISTYPNGAKYFDVAKWKAAFDLTWAAKRDSIAPYLADGTIAAVYGMDEPNCASCWGLDPRVDSVITPSQVDQLAAHVKLRWRYVIFAVRELPQWLVNTPNVDAGWAQWEGKLHLPSNGMTAQQFADSNVRAAKVRGLGLVLAINAPNGGDGSSRINGTVNKDPDLTDAPSWKYRYAMSAAEVLTVGKVFAAEPYACGVSGWMDPPTLARVDVQAAWYAIAAIPRAFTPCRRP